MLLSLAENPFPRSVPSENIILRLRYCTANIPHSIILNKLCKVVLENKTISYKLWTELKPIVFENQASVKRDLFVK